MLSYHNNIVFLLAKAHQCAQGTLKGSLQAHGLTPVQCLVIESLWEEEGLPVGDIGRKLALDTATLAGVLDRMVTAGWVRRETDPDDGRVARIFQTEKAKEASAELAATIERTNNKLLKNFSLEEKVLFKRLLLDFKR